MNSQTNRFHALDLMRFSAAFGVVLYHLTARPDSSFELLSQITKYGYLGVPVFFMISGFVIAISANGRSAYQFGVSRFARLYPGLWACMAVTVLIVYMATGTTFDPFQVAANSTLLNDYVGYEDIDGVYWTLHVELKFYACIFLLIVFNIFHRYHVWLTAWLALSILHMVTHQPWFMGWFIPPGWSPFFIIGVALYHINLFGTGRFNIAILGVALIMACLKTHSITEDFIASTKPFDALISVLILLAFAAVLALAATGRISVKGNRAVLSAGAMTYPVYLLHNRAGKAIIDASEGYLPESLAVTLTIMVVFLVSYVIYQWVEKPASYTIKTHAEWLPQKLAGIKQLTFARQQD